MGFWGQLFSISLFLSLYGGWTEFHLQAWPWRGDHAGSRDPSPSNWTNGHSIRRCCLHFQGHVSKGDAGFRGLGPQVMKLTSHKGAGCFLPSSFGKQFFSILIQFGESYFQPRPMSSLSCGGRDVAICGWELESSPGRIVAGWPEASLHWW